MKLFRMIFIGFIGIMLLSGCDGGVKEKETPSKKVLETAPPTPPM